MLYYFLFELTEFSDNEGEQILCECASLDIAWSILCEQYGFERNELRFIDRMSVEEGEMLGYDTY